MYIIELSALGKLHNVLSLLSEQAHEKNLRNFFTLSSLHILLNWFPNRTFEFCIEDIIELSNNGEAYFVLSIAYEGFGVHTILVVNSPLPPSHR